MINQQIIQEEIIKLTEIKESVKRQLTYNIKQNLDGYKLRATIHGGTYQYFKYKNGMNKNGTYIKKKELSTAKLLTQIEYDKKLLMILTKRIEALKSLSDMLTENPYLQALEQMTEPKRILVNMPFISDEEYILNWISQDYDKLCFKEDAPEFYTKKGLRVRSKSELIIAELLDSFEIPYLYEKPIIFSDGHVVHPDYTILQVKTRKEIIWEHLGMMDDIEYRNNAFMKIRQYEANGYYQGKNMIWTYETAKYPLNMKSIMEMIKVVLTD